MTVSESVIETMNLHKHYGNVIAVDDVSLVVERGEVFGIVGRNGAGKTTIVECIGGLREPDRGTVRVLGFDPVGDRDAIRQRVGIQLQQSELPERIRVAEALELFASFHDRPADWSALLEDLGLAAKRDAAFGTLSGGQRQRLSIALALVGGPEIVIFDELTTGLDPQARRETWHLIEAVRDRGVTVVLVTHFMEEAERLCDRVAVIDAGRIAALDRPGAILADAVPVQRVWFRPETPMDDALMTALPQVGDVVHSGPQVGVTGTGKLLSAVIFALAEHRIVVDELRVEQASLDDAFLALTGTALED